MNQEVLNNATNETIRHFAAVSPQMHAMSIFVTELMHITSLAFPHVHHKELIDACERHTPAGLSEMAEGEISLLINVKDQSDFLNTSQHSLATLWRKTVENVFNSLAMKN